MRIESTCSSAVPLSETAQEVKPGAVALAVPLQAMVAEVVNAPCAVPLSFRSPAQLALKFPLALVAVCSVTFHLKSVHESGDGMRLPDDQLPRRAPLPAMPGSVEALLCSKPTQPGVAKVAAEFLGRSAGRLLARAGKDEEEVYQPGSPAFPAVCR